MLITPSFALADWKVSGPFGGDAEVIRVVPQAEGMVIAGTHNGLLFLSTNGGATWSNIPFEGQLSGVLHTLEVDPRSTGTWYAGMEGDRAWTSGVYKTVDGGASWQLLPGTKGIAIWSLALWPANPDVLVAGAADGVYRSTDAGANWTQISPPGNLELRPVVSLAFHPTNSDIVFAGTTHLPWRTADGGKTWDSIHTGMLDDSDVFSIQVDARQPESVYASACSGLYQSSDSAAHWNKLTTPQGAFRTWFVALDPRHDRFVFAGTTAGLLRSEDSGKTWRLVTSQAVKSIAFDPFVPDRIFFASVTAGLMLSNDGGRTLHESNVGFANRNFTVLAGARGVLYASSVFEPGSGGVYRTDDFGMRWRRAGGEQAGQQIRLLTAAPDEAGTLYAAGYHGLLKSRDGGKTWIGKPAPSPSAHFTSLLALAHDTLLAGTDQGLFRSAQGAPWKLATRGNIASLELSGDRIVAALSAQGASFSPNGGNEWKTCGQPLPSTIWYGLAFDPGEERTALAATSAGLFRSTDGCESWTKAAGGLLPNTVSIVLFHPGRTGEAFAAQDGRVFRSTDGGIGWLPVDDGNGGLFWPSALLVLPEAPGRVFALLPRRGVASNSF